ncbi:MAG: AmmeMemoRadiSam system protein A [Acidobacteriia bacterium]|nr:AmmeMemoRadiSam system protein A [Terriglobia bacterium]
MSPPRPSSISAVDASSPSATEASQTSGAPANSTAPEFSKEERTLLLRLAHDSIRSALEQTELSLEPPTPHLAEPRGVFTSLYLHGDLRGCVGYVLPVSPVYRAAAETARAAAFEDTRFYPVSREEEPNLQVELSILSPPQAIAAQDVEIGRHGLLISRHGNRGLLLPQVPVEHNWDRTTFLEQTCRKAGLPLDAWQNGATIEGFTAEVFGDKDVPA